MEFSVSGWSLADILAEVQKQGIENLSSVRLEMAYIGNRLYVPVITDEGNGEDS